MSTGPDNLYQLAASLLAAVVDQFADDAVTLPARRYVTVGIPAAECDSVIVSFEIPGIWMGGSESSAGAPQQVNRASTRVANLVVSIFRCGYPVNQGTGQVALQAVDPSKYSDYAQTVLTDAYVLHRGVWRARMAATFGDYLSGLSIGSAEPIQPDGGIGGTRMAITAELS